MGSVAKQDYYLFSELCRSLAGQRLLTNVDTVVQLWFESDQNQYVQSQWKKAIPGE